MKLAVTIKGVIDIPDEWLDPDKDGDYPLEVADERYNDQLAEEAAIDELAMKIKAYPEELNVVFDHVKEGADHV